MKVGDKVEIINPELWLRTGYKYGKKEARELLQQDLLNKGSSIKKQLKLAFPFSDNHWKLEDIIVQMYNSSVLKFGGDERTLHMERDESLKGLFGTVTETKRTVTGIRVQGGGYDDPSFLTKQKPYIMCRVTITSDDGGENKNFGWSSPVKAWDDISIADSEFKFRHGKYWFRKEDLSLAIPGPV
jgi:hypothetical protein